MARRERIERIAMEEIAAARSRVAGDLVHLREIWAKLPEMERVIARAPAA